MKGDSPGEKEKANRCPPTGSIYTHCREAATTTLGAKGAVKPENLKNPRPRSGRPPLVPDGTTFPPQAVGQKDCGNPLRKR